MIRENYNCSIVANITPKQAIKGISQVSDWWSKNIDGKSEKIKDVFPYRSRDTWVALKITECVAENYGKS